MIRIKTLLTEVTKKDTLFSARYLLDPYQHCGFNCLYCDSSAEKVKVKINAPEVLEKELANKKKGLIVVGFASEPYQNIDNKYGLTRSILENIVCYDFPCHVVTKSNLVLRDVDVLTELSCAVTVSLSTGDTRIAKILEPNAPSPAQRLEIIRKLSASGIPTGIAIIPFLPYITAPERLIKEATTKGAEWALWEYLELKGEQKVKYLKVVEEYFCNLLPRYEKLYACGYKPNDSYSKKEDDVFKALCKKYGLKNEVRTS